MVRQILPVLIQTGLLEISVIVLLIAVQDGAVGADYDFPVREIGLDGRGNAVEYLYIQQAVGKLFHRFITLVIAQAVPGHMELEKAGVIRQAALCQQKAVGFLLKLFLPENGPWNPTCPGSDGTDGTFLLY